MITTIEASLKMAENVRMNFLEINCTVLSVEQRMLWYTISYQISSYVKPVKRIEIHMPKKKVLDLVESVILHFTRMSNLEVTKS